ncbi:hypothetical protein [Streptomyces laurentii]
MELGPLVRGDDGVWMLGDKEGKPGAGWILFLPDGLEHWDHGVRQPVVPWSRLMLMESVGPLWRNRTRVPPALIVTVRHPYETWTARFTRHPHRYAGTHMYFLQELFRQVINEGEAACLGDPEWLAQVVDELAPQRMPWSWKAFGEAVTRARKSATAAI